MNIIAYEHGIDNEVDYAPESYLNIGMLRLSDNHRRDRRAMSIQRYTRRSDIVRARVARIDQGIESNHDEAVY